MFCLSAGQNFFFFIFEATNANKITFQIYRKVSQTNSTWCNIS